MARGKITRIVGGSNTIECDQWSVYTDQFIAYAEKGSYFTADEGTNIGKPKDPPPAGKYFVKGWWTDEDDKPITEAYIGDKVKFHLQMQNIPEEDKKRQVKMELRDFEEFSLLYYILGVETDKFKGYDKISINSFDNDGNVYTKEYWEIDSDQRIELKLVLGGESLIKLLSEEHDRNLELYFRTSYTDHKSNIEVLHFPEMECDYLKVNPPPVVEPIIFVHASNEHLLPAIYSAKDGSPWYVAAFKNGMYTNKINGLVKPYDLGGKKELTFFEKNAYKIAIRKLEKGELIFNTGRKGTTSRFHQYDIVYIDGQFKDKIKMGVNRGTGIPGETSRGINQIEAQSQRGIPNTIKTVGEIVGIFGVLSDLTALLRGVADHQIPMPSYVPPFITMEVDRMMRDNDEFIIEHWNIDLQKAIREGKNYTKYFLENNDTNRSKNLGFKVIDMSEDGMTKVLSKEIDAIKDPTNSNSPKMLESLSNIGEGNQDSGLLIQSMESLDKYNRLTTFHYIHAIFVNDLKI